MKRSKGLYTDPTKVGERNPTAKLTAEDIRWIRRDPRSARAMARELKMHHSTINEIRNGRLWKHVA